MKLTVKVFSNYDEYEEQMEQHRDDPLLYPKPEVITTYELFNVADEFITCYRVVEQDEIIEVYTTLEQFNVLVVELNEETLNKLEKIIEFRNKKYHKLF